MAANNNNEDCLTINADTHPADILEWLAKILEPGHYCQSRDADGRLVLNVDYTGGAMPATADVPITNLIVYLERRKWYTIFRLQGMGIHIAVFKFHPRWIPKTPPEQDLMGGWLVDESFAGLLQDKSNTWEAEALSVFNDRSLTFSNLSGPFSRLTPVVSPGSTVKSAGKD
jgi:hypothetical protein